MDESTSVRKVIQEYIDACSSGSVERLQAIFHPNALMSGYMRGQYLMGSLQPFYEAVRGAPAPAASGADYRAEITSIEVSGPVASVTLKEKGYLGMNFTDFFHLAKVDGSWKIISKTFNPE